MVYYFLLQNVTSCVFIGDDDFFSDAQSLKTFCKKSFKKNDFKDTQVT